MTFLNKIIGYVLLIAGLALIVFMVSQSYSIFTGKALPPVIFKVSSFQSALEKSTEPLDLQGQMQNVVNQQIGQVLPPEILPKIFNLVAWSFFAFILIFAGGTIASIGVKLIKIV
ncbi:MAG: hypothetical protein US31_C0003G0036 [Berkelbacteria bacterium GW2011_GWA1_36_9]|uniref:Uncharacterized protein n=1 Tax=Berkelbacteria bacterium GW2011_GWA1_36_9 TaxID=1618331 RepID=A0A0G0FLD4_9BACT|nr:MAG: hypothetical protein US31_C0003G0036 [Berkelbacteria bacterium GW2011_GWA1_36_9]